MKYPRIFVWNNFKKLDLSNWESCKKNVTKIPGIEMILPALPTLNQSNIEKISDYIEHLYSEIYCDFELNGAEEIKKRAKYIYNLLIKSKDFKIDEATKEYQNNPDDFVDFDDYSIGWDYSNLLQTAHSNLVTKKIYEEYENFYVLSLMLIDKFLQSKGNNKFLLAYEALHTFKDGQKIHYSKRNVKEIAVKRANSRHQINHYLRLMTLVSACRVSNDHPTWKLQRIARKIYPSIRNKAEKLNYRYSPDRFENTVYEWLLKGEKTGTFRKLLEQFSNANGDVITISEDDEDYSWLHNALKLIDDM